MKKNEETTDDKLIALFFDRAEDAVERTEQKYGRYIYSIAHNLLNDEEDSKECVNDTLYIHGRTFRRTNRTALNPTSQQLFVMRRWNG